MSIPTGSSIVNRKTCPERSEGASIVNLILPHIESEEEFDRRFRESDWTVRAAEEICARHGIPSSSLARYPTGSAIVFATGAGEVVKLFSPFSHMHFRTERDLLGMVAGKLPLPTPDLIAAGELEGWPYIIMTELRGMPLRSVWEEIPADERLRLAHQIGEGIAALHALPVEPLLHASPDPEVADWSSFITRQMARCAERQRRMKTPEEWVEQIPDFLAGCRIDTAPGSRRAILHTEIMREHLLADRTSSGWRITGLVDFEPGMAGDPEYEFASVGVFVSEGDEAILRAILSGYGYPVDLPDPLLQSRFLAHALLHRYSSLRWYLERIPPRARTLEELGGEWWKY